MVNELRTLFEPTIKEAGEEGQVIPNERLALTAVDLAELMIGARRLRAQHFSPKVFGEPGWDILLGLHVAYHQGRAVSVSAATTFGDTPSTTGLRWLAILAKEGLIDRCDDPDDKRRSFVGLSAVAVAKMDAFMTSFAEWASTRATMRQL